MSAGAGIDIASIASRVLDTVGGGPGCFFYAAYSGGVDSTVLVHILARVARDSGSRLVALHADHGLHPRSGQWRRHCRQQCGQWGLELRSTTLEYAADNGLGPEARAREARYRWFHDVVGGERWLFTAHHRGDQAETVVERLTRGAGPGGIRAMLPTTRVYGVKVARPLLEASREAIEAYAVHHRLQWVTDDSNRDSAFTRNYIRNQVLPVLKARWPGVETALSRTADTMREVQELLEEVAETDLAGLDPRPIGGEASLLVPALLGLSPQRQRNVIRHWIHQQLGIRLGTRRVARAVDEISRLPERPGGLCWPPVDLRVYRDRLYLVRPDEGPSATRHWELDADLPLGRHLVLRPRRTVGSGLKAQALKGSVGIRFREGGEKCTLPGRRHRSAVKKLLQEAGIPPWQRRRVPLILVGGEIAAVAGLTCCEPFIAAPGEPGVEIEVIRV